ncbi:MAG: VCBS repeat-containing protein, partial [Hymenobacter sp.]
GDIDGDGDLDAVTRNEANGGVVRPQVYQFTAATGGTGRGLSWSTADRLIGNNSPVLATGDLDGDGDLDVLTATSSGFNNTIGVLLNNGQSQFQVGASLSPGTASGATYMALGDVDGDGDLDALVSSFNAGLLVYRNNGNATFAAGVAQSATGDRFALGDLDADGDLDLVVTDYQRGTVSVALNTGSGTFVFQLLTVASPTALHVVLGDIDGDGDLDAVTRNEANGARLFLNNGTGTLSVGATLTVPGSADGLALADIDADGDVDLAISYNDASAAGGLALFANNGSGLFARTGPAVAVGQSAGATLFGDIDHDGDLDLFTISQNTSSVAIRLNNGQGSFSGTQNVAVHADPMLLALGDFDGDGDLDFMTTLSSTGTTYLDVRLNEGTVLVTTATQPGLPGVEVYPNPAHAQFVVRVPAALR